jgi:hypothetical protein
VTWFMTLLRVRECQSSGLPDEGIPDDPGKTSAAGVTDILLGVQQLSHRRMSPTIDDILFETRVLIHRKSVSVPKIGSVWTKRSTIQLRFGFPLRSANQGQHESHSYEMSLCTCYTVKGDCCTFKQYRSLTPLVNTVSISLHHLMTTISS